MLPKPVPSNDKARTVMGHRLESPRLTGWGFAMLAASIAAPVLGLGLLADLLVQVWTGRCLGLWCLF